MTQKYICQGNTLPGSSIYLTQSSDSDESAGLTGVSTLRIHAPDNHYCIRPTRMRKRLQYAASDVQIAGPCSLRLLTFTVSAILLDYLQLLLAYMSLTQHRALGQSDSICHVCSLWHFVVLCLM